MKSLSKRTLIELGKKLYIKISEVIRAEIDDITEDDCINFVINLVINRTFDGYVSEKILFMDSFKISWVLI